VAGPLSIVLIVPGALTNLTGGYIYDRRMVDELRKLGWVVDVRQLDSSFPQPTPAARAAAARTLANIPDGSTVVVDGLALGALGREAERESRRLRLVALVHHPLAEETGLDPLTAAELRTSERQALAATRRVIVTSRPTAEALESYGVPLERVTVVQPGTDAAPRARGSGGSGVQLLCVAALVPRKGHDTLVRALARLVDRRWHLTCVGSLDRHPETVRHLCAYLVEAGFAARVRLVGEADGMRLSEYYDGADVFVLPTRYEGYGMVVAEALARGLPVVSTPTGAIPELVGEDAGILVRAGDADAFCSALGRVMDDRRLLESLRRGAARARERLPGWADSAASLAHTLADV
jgi:glycosyltransferase involved in cell wall biosynthesis